MNELIFELGLSWGIPLLLIIIGYVTGSIIERRHFRRIIRREEEQRDLLAFGIRRMPDDLILSDPKLVRGGAVISVDYFKVFAASLRGIIGGRIGAYESLFERARREAIIRMKDNAREQGGDIVLNVRLETTRIFSGGGSVTVSVEAMAFGTAYRTGEASAQIL